MSQTGEGVCQTVKPYNLIAKFGLNYDIQCTQAQAQATIIARVAYMLLNLFILSTAFRCNSDALDGWHSSNLAYTAGFAATALVSIALYIALTFRDPGFIPVAHGLRQQVSTMLSR